MERYKAKSDLLRGKGAERGMEELAIVVAREFGFDAAQDVLAGIIAGLDGGPEQFSDNAARILADIHASEDMSRTRELTIELLKFIEETSGWFDYDKIDRELGIKTTAHKAHRRKMIQRRVQGGLLKAHPKIDGRFIKVEGDLTEMDWQGADLSQKYKLVWPFGIHRLVDIYPKNIVVLAGAPDSGKTAFLFNFVMLNMNNYPINYFNSEMGEPELYTRLSKFRTVPTDRWKFKVYERTSSFAEVIKPDEINIIDFLEINDAFYQIAGQIREIFDVLNKGICIIAIQKKRPQPGKDGQMVKQDLGRGAEFALEKPRLYLSMDGGGYGHPGTLKIVKAKNWAGVVNPNGRIFEFKLVDGCKFIETNKYGDDDPKY